tara:strand:- start:165 stop:347 length:183 start_codon:yes stop_codon:yes gene_type:complete
MMENVGREERIRTSGPCVPNAVLYQAELLPDPFAFLRTKDVGTSIWQSEVRFKTLVAAKS